jgi:murein DD-endopeptidase MepM/ murein hydrolase activator NlpD
VGSLPSARRGWRKPLHLTSCFAPASVHAALVLTFAVAPAAPPPSWSAPVDGPVVRRFDPPAKPWASGHRGVDFAVAAGTPVRAAAPGVVAFAGPVAGAISVTVSHPGGLRSGYSFLASLAVAAGERVATGRVLGLSGGRGPGHGPDALHFSVRQGPDYVDPQPLLRANAAVRLVPLQGSPRAPCPTLAANPVPTGKSARPHPPVVPPGTLRAEAETVGRSTSPWPS